MNKMKLLLLIILILKVRINQIRRVNYQFQIKRMVENKITILSINKLIVHKIMINLDQSNLRLEK
jgi:hypothetical protein